VAKVKIKIPTVDSMVKRKIATRKFRDKLGRLVLKEILSSIARGISPVRGHGRFKGYKVDRSTGKAKAQAYPNSVKDKFPSKRKRPVNLKLSGDLLKAMRFRRLVGGVEVGLINASKKLKAIFEGHNEGSNLKAKLPQRKILPTGPKDRFKVSIQRRIVNLYLARIRQIISRSRRR